MKSPEEVRALELQLATNRELAKLRDDWNDAERRSDALRAELAREREAHEDADILRAALVAARNAVVAFQSEVGYLPEQQAYATTITDAQRQCCEVVAAIDRILQDDNNHSVRYRSTATTATRMHHDELAASPAERDAELAREREARETAERERDEERALLATLEQRLRPRFQATGMIRVWKCRTCPGTAEPGNEFIQHAVDCTWVLLSARAGRG